MLDCEVPDCEVLVLEDASVPMLMAILPRRILIGFIFICMGSMGFMGSIGCIGSIGFIGFIEGIDADGMAFIRSKGEGCVWLISVSSACERGPVLI